MPALSVLAGLWTQAPHLLPVDVEQHEEWIKQEVLAVRIELDGATGEPAVELAL